MCGVYADSFIVYVTYKAYSIFSYYIYIVYIRVHLWPLSLSFGDNDRPCGIKPIKSTGTSATTLPLAVPVPHTSPCRRLIGYAHPVVCSASSYRFGWLLLLTFCNWCWKLQLWKLGNAQRGWRWLQSALSVASSLSLTPPRSNTPCIYISLTLSSVFLYLAVSNKRKF